MNLLANWHFFLSQDDILRGQGVDPETIRARRQAMAQTELCEACSLPVRGSTAGLAG